MKDNSCLWYPDPLDFIESKRQKMSNNEIRLFISLSGIKQHEVANKLGIADTYLSRLLQRELSEKWKEKIVSAIKEILTQKRNEIDEILEKIENHNN